MHRFNGPTGRGLAAAVVSSVFCLGFAAQVSAQGSLTTSDGMKFSLTSNGSVTDLQQNGVEYAGSGVVSGFHVSGVAGGGDEHRRPTGRSRAGRGVCRRRGRLDEQDGGDVGFGHEQATAGTRSMKVSISGTTAKTQPDVEVERVFGVAERGVHGDAAR